MRYCKSLILSSLFAKKNFLEEGLKRKCTLERRNTDTFFKFQYRGFLIQETEPKSSVFQYITMDFSICMNKRDNVI